MSSNQSVEGRNKVGQLANNDIVHQNFYGDNITDRLRHKIMFWMLAWGLIVMLTTLFLTVVALLHIRHLEQDVLMILYKINFT